LSGSSTVADGSSGTGGQKLVKPIDLEVKKTKLRQDFDTANQELRDAEVRAAAARTELVGARNGLRQPPQSPDFVDPENIRRGRVDRLNAAVTESQAADKLVEEKQAAVAKTGQAALDDAYGGDYGSLARNWIDFTNFRSFVQGIGEGAPTGIVNTGKAVYNLATGNGGSTVTPDARALADQAAEERRNLLDMDLLRIQDGALANRQLGRLAGEEIVGPYIAAEIGGAAVVGTVRAGTSVVRSGIQALKSGEGAGEAGPLIKSGPAGGSTSPTPLTTPPGAGPQTITSSAGRTIGSFERGKDLEIISKKEQLYGGNTIKLDAQQTTTVTGTLDDVNVVARRGERLPGSTLQGENAGGVNILRSPRWGEIQQEHKAILESGDKLTYWRTVTNQFWDTVNKPWLDQAIARGDKIRLVSNPNEAAKLFVTDKAGTFVLDEGGNKIRSIFGREVDYLTSKGYTLLSDGTAVPRH
jgi:hypothetical protein